jgi:DNA-binding transcriptional ArsR family regulator
MGVTRLETFTAEQNRIADLAKAFAHPSRVATLQVLAQRKTCVCGDLVSVLPLSQATVSGHLKELKRIGIVKGEVDPPRVCYCINEPVWEEARQTFGGLFDSLIPPPVVCC